jgi:hypothetical protein
VLEQLGLEIRASAQLPRTLPNGEWNPVVRTELEDRLKKTGINLSDRFHWMIRGSKTRIESDQPNFIYRNSVNVPWSRGTVRDLEVDIADAIAHASWLRNLISAHYLDPDKAKVLSVYVVANVQHLARRLLLATLGFWREHTSDNVIF